MPWYRNATLTILGSLILVWAALQPVHAAAKDATQELRQEHYQSLDADYSAIQRKFERGEITGENLRDAFRAFYPTDGDLAAKYDGWVKAFPHSYVARLARGITSNGRITLISAELAYKFASAA